MFAGASLWAREDTLACLSPRPAQPSETCQGSQPVLLQLYGLLVPHSCFLHLLLQDEEVAQLCGHKCTGGAGHEDAFHEAAHKPLDRLVPSTLPRVDIRKQSLVSPTYRDEGTPEWGAAFQLSW